MPERLPVGHSGGAGWGLAEIESGDLMQAVAAVLDPWMGDHGSTVLFEGEPMPIRVRGIREDAPDEIKRLDVVYMGIIEKGACAVDPEEIARHSAPSLQSLCSCGAPGKGQHSATTCTHRADNSGPPHLGDTTEGGERMSVGQSGGPVDRLQEQLVSLSAYLALNAPSDVQRECLRRFDAIEAALAECRERPMSPLFHRDRYQALERAAVNVMERRRNGSLGGWNFPGTEALERLEAVLRTDPSLTVEEATNV